MKLVVALMLVCTFLLTGFSRKADEVEFVCLKTHKASNTCHFNFRVNGANYRFVDVGCKYSKKQSELVKKVQDGEIFLAREWKVSCGQSEDSAKK